MNSISKMNGGKNPFFGGSLNLAKQVFVSGIALMLAVTLLTSCASKKKSESDAETPLAEGVVDPQIENKNIAFDPMGSDSGRISGLSTIYFDYDKALLSPEAKKSLQSNAAWIKANPDVTIQVEGHCDQRGSIEYNIALGERRATSVKNYLVSMGIPAKRLTIISYGKEKPIETGDGEAALAKNRRANFVPLPK